MQWTDEAIVLGVKRHGETSVILELMTHGHGRHLGLVRGGAGTRMRGVLQPGNGAQPPRGGRGSTSISAITQWRPSICARRAFFRQRTAVHGVTHLAALCRLLAEREQHAAIYGALERDPRQPRGSARRRANDRAVRARLPRGTGLRPRSFILRRDRRDERSPFTCRRDRDARFRARAARPIATS